MYLALWARISAPVVLRGAGECKLMPAMCARQCLSFPDGTLPHVQVLVWKP